jgi:hypothetical protein
VKAHSYPPSHLHDCNPPLVAGGDAAIRSRWLALFRKARRDGRPSYACVDIGIHTIVLPLSKGATVNTAQQFEEDLRAVVRQVPELGREGKISLADALSHSISEGGRPCWLGEFAQSITQGKIIGEVFVDLAYLEAALLHEFWECNVEMDFGTPLTFFHRAGLSDYADVLEAAAWAVGEGISLQTAAIRLARDVARDLETYAQVFLRLSALFPQCRWSIKGQQFAVKIPRRLNTWNFSYWDLKKDDPLRVVQEWGEVVDRLLREANVLATPELPNSHAA